MKLYRIPFEYGCYNIFILSQLSKYPKSINIDHMCPKFELIYEVKNHRLHNHLRFTLACNIDTNQPEIMPTIVLEVRILTQTHDISRYG